MEALEYAGQKSLYATFASISRQTEAQLKTAEQTLPSEVSGFCRVSELV